MSSKTRATYEHETLVPPPAHPFHLLRFKQLAARGVFRSARRQGAGYTRAPQMCQANEPPNIWHWLAGPEGAEFPKKKS